MRIAHADATLAPLQVGPFQISGKGSRRSTDLSLQQSLIVENVWQDALDVP